MPVDIILNGNQESGTIELNKNINGQTIVDTQVIELLSKLDNRKNRFESPHI